ncbi:hypothetical protein [Streptomyces chryseus]|uniref:Regulatory protein n=1 Tax=Streptomyces chryseus TaxID=68186 RepID=A0ABQ3DN58_9ACTN|nr:hypothetical protein [Streptomyces chryseus]GHB06391.1 hypothetical protein GCM10010346_32060 [Streptomyces chryseus]
MAEDNPSLQSQYAGQVDADLERNTAEQERIRSEVDALRSRLEALEKDHELLVSMRAALGAPAARKTKQVRQTRTAAPTVPGARRAKAASTDDKSAAKRTAERTGGTAPASTVAKAGRTAPPLRELVVAVLAKHDEPRSAAEVTQELTEAHPGRTLSVTVVRNALEASVAKNQSERTKQQKSVYYRAVRNDGANEEAAAAPSAVGA